jgi:putative transcriptional regulator
VRQALEILAENFSAPKFGAMSSSPLSVAGSLLVAAPTLLDPNFRRSVIFLATNDADDGSFGMIVNRAMGKTVEEILPDRDVGLLAKVPVFFGGPVGHDQLTFASFRWHDDAHRIECRSHLTLEEAGNIAQENFNSIRAFVGYSGWSQGQLETELAQNAWIVQKPGPDSLNPKKLDGLWRGILREMGPMYRLLADAPDDPSQN